MTKTTSGVLLGLGFMGLAVLLAGQQQAHATPGAGCKQWQLKAFHVTDDATLPEGWEPFAVISSLTGVGGGVGYPSLPEGMRTRSLGRETASRWVRDHRQGKW